MSTNPTFIQEPWAVNADPAFINAIPVTTATPGKASLDQGWPADTMQPVIAGGVPPTGQDMNGIFNLITQHTVFLQGGNLYTFSQDWVDAGNSYNLGNLVVSADGSTLWMCNANGVTEDPDGTTSSRWVAAVNVNDTTTSFPTNPVTGGTVALPPLAAARPVLVFTGVLTSNCRVNVPRHQVRSWLIVNQCTGAFSLTVGTSVGTGVVVPSGGFAQPTGVYSDGANIYPSVSPLSVPISTAPTPSTIVERDNNGYVFATQFNQNSATENPAIDSVFCQSGGDGFLRKLTKANFAANLLVSTFAGQVLAAQVPLAAVSQWAASIFANAALTGNPTAPTAATGDSDTSIATTAFANPAQSQAANGYVKFPGGIILQWGFAQGAAGAGSTAVAFPIAFPTACFAALCTTANRNSMGSNGYNFVDSLTVNGMNAWFDVQQTGGGSGNRGGYWFAIGH